MSAASTPRPIRSPAELAQAQLEAYNRKDLEAFCACYSEDVKVWHPPEPEPRLSGMTAFRARYAAGPFAQPAAQAEVSQRLVLPEMVVDHEVVHGRGDAPHELAVVYRCREGLIAEVFFFTQPA